MTTMGVAVDRAVLEVTDLHVEFATYGGIVQAVRGASFAVRKGETLAIVGESGCGKSVSVQSIMGLIPHAPGTHYSGTAMLDGVDIIRQKVIDGHDVRGNPDRHDLSGPDELAEPHDDGRRADRRDAGGAPRLQPSQAFGRAVELLA
jgi:ABC-type dipeptide/oligopeptide/nickel transport system ATPase component